jgi:hypothetical protein
MVIIYSMGIKGPKDNTNHRFSRRQLGSQHSHFSVTQKQESPEPLVPVTPRTRDSHARRYSELKPWFWLANLALRRRDGSLLLPDGVQDSDLEELWDTVLGRAWEWENGPLRNLYNIIDVSARGRSIPEKQQWLCRLVFSAASIFDSFARGEVDPAVQTPGSFALFRTRGGKIAVKFSDPYRDLSESVDGAESARIRRCQICGTLFYALRATQKSCSKRCNATRRVRRWRELKEQQIQRASRLRRDGKDIVGIAKELGVNTTKARHFIARARKEKA